MGPLAYVDNSRWQFLPYQSASAWQDYLNRIYVPHLQHLQALYARVPDLIQLGDQALRSSAPSWADYFGRQEFRIKGGYRMLPRSGICWMSSRPGVSVATCVH